MHRPSLPSRGTSDAAHRPVQTPERPTPTEPTATSRLRTITGNRFWRKRVGLPLYGNKESTIATRLMKSIALDPEMVDRAIEPVVSALRKAEEHAAAADAIAALGYIPMAFSHVVLGLEEMATAKLHKGALLGLFTIGGPDDPDDPFQLERKELYAHKTKLLAIVFYVAAWRVERVRRTFLLEAAKRHEEADKAELLRREEVASKEAMFLAGELQRLEPLKEGGLYSGEFDRKGRPAIRATRDDYDRWRTALQDCIDAEQFFLTHPDEKVDDVMLKVAQDAKAALIGAIQKAMAEEARRSGTLQTPAPTKEVD